MDKDERRSKASSSRGQSRDRDDLEKGLAIEAGFEKWVAIARHAGRSPETRTGRFPTSLALAQEIEAEEGLLVTGAKDWSAAAFFEAYTAGEPDYTKGSEHYVVRYRAAGEARVLKATIPGKFGRYQYSNHLSEFVTALESLRASIGYPAPWDPSRGRWQAFVGDQHAVH